MGKIYTALGLMSGTSIDGIDASIIKSDGNREYSPLLDRYFEYGDEIRQRIFNIRSKILVPNHLIKYESEIKDVEREITLFHASVVREILNNTKIDLDLLGFHGQTIFHDSKKKITKQLGDGKLLSQLTKKKVAVLFIDEKTFRVVKLLYVFKNVNAGGESELLETFFSDFKKEDGLTTPSSFKAVHGGKTIAYGKIVEQILSENTLRLNTFAKP